MGYLRIDDIEEAKTILYWLSKNGGKPVSRRIGSVNLKGYHLHGSFEFDDEKIKIKGCYVIPKKSGIPLELFFHGDETQINNTETLIQNIRMEYRQSVMKKYTEEWCKEVGGVLEELFPHNVTSRLYKGLDEVDIGNLDAKNIKKLEKLINDRKGREKELTDILNTFTNKGIKLSNEAIKKLSEYRKKTRALGLIYNSYSKVEKTAPEEDETIGELVKEIESGIFLCPECGSFVDAKSQICTNCGMNMFKKEPEPVDKKIKQKDTDENKSPGVFLCPNCGAFMRSDSKTCPTCGVEFNDDFS